MAPRLSAQEQSEILEDVLFMLDTGAHPSTLVPRLRNRVSMFQIQRMLKLAGHSAYANRIRNEMIASGLIVIKKESVDA